MPDRLREILEAKRVEIAALIPRAEALAGRPWNGTSFAVSAARSSRDPDDSLALIAEIKRASPSAGLIAPDFDPPTIARRYEEAGADCISVLTDAPFFQGRLDYLQAVREACALPLLRKDFILHEAQVYESVCAGADAILLIVAALETGELDRLLRLARDFQLDVLVEVHTLAEMERAVDSGADLIGINNRNLATFEVDLGTTDRAGGRSPRRNHAGERERVAHRRGQPARAGGRSRRDPGGRNADALSAGK